METLAGESVWWVETASRLNLATDERADRISQSICALTAVAAPFRNQPAALAEYETQHLKRLLQAPSHPELLGRLGRYELEQLVGRGGMGLVFRARDTELHRVVAVKTLALPILDHPEARQRFAREARVAAALAHPHIVPVHDVITDGPIPALVMQFVAGTTLELRLQQDGKLPWREACLIGLQLAEALATAHRHGLVHRDIKPGNVMLEAGGSRALLTDFGLVRALDAATLTRSGALAGTPDFMSPEQARGAAVDGRSDLFSLGSLIYTMIAGQPPFRADDPMATLNRICHQPHRRLSSWQSEVPRGVSRLIDQLLVKQPARRLGDANQAAEQFQILLHSPSHSLAPWYPISPIRRRRLAAAAVLVLLLAGGLAAQSRWLQRQNQTQFQQLSDHLANQFQPAAPTAANTPAMPTAGSSPESFVAMNQRPRDQRIDDRIRRLKQKLDAYAAADRPRPNPDAEIMTPGTSQPNFTAEVNNLKVKLGRLKTEFSQTELLPIVTPSGTD